MSARERPGRNCPITQMVMKKPAMATDGHSYELKAMQKWLLKKQTSPVTGKPLANTTLVINQNLKKLIRDFTSPIRGAWPATTAAGHSISAPKRKAPIDEDLFGADDDDDDDAPAYRHATYHHATAGVAATVDEASSSATGAPPARKRMKAPRRM